MRPKYKQYTTTGIKEWIVLDHYGDQYDVAVVIKSGTATYTVEYTKAALLQGDLPAAGEVFSVPAQTGQSGNTDQVYQGPLTGVRLNISAISGVVELQVLTHSEDKPR